jgi:hypothetical protein
MPTKNVMKLMKPKPFGWGIVFNDCIPFLASDLVNGGGLPLGSHINYLHTIVWGLYSSTLLQHDTPNLTGPKDTKGITKGIRDPT